MVLKEVANENPIRLQRRLPGQRDSVPLYICDPEIMIFLWDCKAVHKHTHTQQAVKFCNPVYLAIIRFSLQ